MPRVKRSTSHKVFYSYFETMSHVYETRFSKHNFKKPDGFSKYIKFLINY